MTFDKSVAVGRANLNDCVRGAACTVTDFPYTVTASRVVADAQYLIYAYSESATIASQQKLDLIAHPVDAAVNFMLLANPNRPNGGILERFVGAYIPVLGVTFSGATATYSPMPKPLTTVDIARQYDGWSDFPTNPLNLLSVANAMLGTILVHGNYFGVGTPRLQGQYQDTTYYLIPTPIAPLLTPLTWIPVVGRPLAIALDAPLRVLVETGYDRTTNPGQPTPARYLYLPDLICAAIAFAVAIPTGWDDAISYLAGNPALRPFHTVKPTSPYGVGGPPVYAGAIDPYGPPTPSAIPPVDAGHDATASAVLVETAAAPEETLPVLDETAAAPEETAAAPEETLPVLEETAAVLEETAAAPEETAEPAEETAEAAEETALESEVTPTGDQGEAESDPAPADAESGTPTAAENATG